MLLRALRPRHSPDIYSHAAGSAVCVMTRWDWIIIARKTYLHAVIFNTIHAQLYTDVWPSASNLPHRTYASAYRRPRFIREKTFIPRTTKQLAVLQYTWEPLRTALALWCSARHRAVCYRRCNVDSLTPWNTQSLRIPHMGSLYFPYFSKPSQLNFAFILGQSFTHTHQ